MKTEKAKEVKQESQETQVNSEIIADVQRSETEVIRISTREYKGVPYVDLRIFFKDKTGEYRPTKKGLTVRKEQIHEIAKAVCLAEEAFAS